jgi:hypothetical protein
MKIRYLAGRKDHRRILRPQDLKQINVPYTEGTLTWEGPDHTLDLSQEVCDALLTALPTEFAIMTAPTDEVEVVLDDDDNSGEDDPDSSASDSLSEADDDDESSTDQVDLDA